MPKVKITKAEVKTPSSLMKLKFGDQTSSPAKKIPAAIRLTSPPRVKQELINLEGFRDCGRKRIRDEFKPTTLIAARRPIAEMIAELKPTSYSE